MTRQHTIIEKGYLALESNSHFKVFDSLQNCRPPTAEHKFDAIIRLTNTPLGYIIEYQYFFSDNELKQYKESIFVEDQLSFCFFFGAHSRFFRSQSVAQPEGRD